jgi:hypothetical protein
MFPFELGVQYAASSVMVYVLDAEHKKYFDNAIQRVSSLIYENKAMENEFKRYLRNEKRNLEVISFENTVYIEGKVGSVEKG